MDLAHLHLMLCHAPIFGVAFSLLVFIIGFILKKEILYKVALCGFIASAIIVFPAYLTGESAERNLMIKICLTESDIEPHEEASTISFVLTLILGAVSIFALWFQQKKYQKWIYLLVFALALVAFGTFSYTAYLGGKLRHTEVDPNIKFEKCANEPVFDED